MTRTPTDIVFTYIALKRYFLLNFKDIFIFVCLLAHCVGVILGTIAVGGWDQFTFYNLTGVLPLVGTLCMKKFFVKKASQIDCRKYHFLDLVKGI